MKILIAAALCLLALASSATAADPPASMAVELRLRGSAEAIPALRGCLTKRLPELPDVKVVGKEAASRFVIDAVVTTASQNRVTASFIVLSRFPRDEFAPTLEAMPDGEALTKQLGFFTLLRQHDLLFDLPVEQACRTIVEGFRQVSLHPELREQND